MSRSCNVKISWAYFVGLVLISHYSAEARRLDAEDVLMGPRRQLLATRTVSGKITWADNAAPIVGATIKAYDNDVIGSDYMGSTSTNSDGVYVLSYTQKDWDSCCLGAKNPDIVLEVIINGRLYYKSGEITNVASSLSGRNIAVPRYIVTGSVSYLETCSAAVGATATVKDSDLIGDETMGSGVTNSVGVYSIILPRKNGDSNWDIINSNPDPFVQFTGPYGVFGKTGTKDDVSSTVLNYGSGVYWRNDANSTAKTIKAGISGESPRDYISVTEYNHCSPKRMIVTIKLDIGKAVVSAPSDSQVPRLKALLKQGIRENWSRTGVRALNIPGKGVYDVYVNVVEDGNGYPVSLKWASKVQKSCERSNNIGIPVLSLDLTMWYNAGCAKFADPVGWQAIADGLFAETGGHEWGHTILQHAVGLTYSWTHKGSSTILQNPSDSATNWAASGDIDIMLYYKNGLPPAARTFATDLDVRRLISLAKYSYAKYCGSCPT